MNVSRGAVVALALFAAAGQVSVAHAAGVVVESVDWGHNAAPLACGSAGSVKGRVTFKLRGTLMDATTPTPGVLVDLYDEDSYGYWHDYLGPSNETFTLRSPGQGRITMETRDFEIPLRCTSDCTLEGPLASSGESEAELFLRVVDADNDQLLAGGRTEPDEALCARPELACAHDLDRDLRLALRERDIPKAQHAKVSNLLADAKHAAREGSLGELRGEFMALSESLGLNEKTQDALMESFETCAGESGRTGK